MVRIKDRYRKLFGGEVAAPGGRDPTIFLVEVTL
jgi:hypothetical protein